jgi:hypothetical protein
MGTFVYAYVAYAGLITSSVSAVSIVDVQSASAR